MRQENPPQQISVDKTISSGKYLRVAMLCGSQLHIGGIEKHILYLLSKSNKERYRFSIIAPTSDEFAKEASAAGAKIISWMPQSRLDWQALTRLYRLLKQLDLDLLHIHDARAGLIGRLVARWLKIPVVYTVHLPSYYYASTRFQRWLYQRLEAFLNHRFTKRVIYVSASVYEEALRYGLAPASRTTLINNGIDLEACAIHRDASLLRAELNTPTEIPVICFIGRLSVEKGPDLLIEALPKIVAESASFYLWVVGDGAMRRELETRVSNLQLESRIRFLGFRKDTVDLLWASDIFVFPSRYEGGVSYAILEAMAAGKPCIVTNVGDNARLVGHGHEGLVVPANDAGALANNIVRLLKESDLRRAMGEAAKQKVKSFEVKSAIARVQAVYESTGQSL